MFNAFQSTNAGFQDAFLVKFGSFGFRIWSTYYGGNFIDIPQTCAADADGNIFLCGTTSSSNFPTANTIQSFGGGSQDAFVVKFNGSGGRLWATYYGGEGSDDLRSSAVDASGNLYLAGYTTSSDFPVANAFQTNNNGSIDAFLLKLVEPKTIISSASGSWTNPATWLEAEVPAATDSVVIADTHNIILSQDATIRSLLVSTGASLQLTNAATLSLEENANVESDIAGNGSVNFLDGSSHLLLGGGSLNNVDVNDELSLLDPITINGMFSLNAAVSTGANQLTLGRNASLFTTVNDPLSGSTNVRANTGVEGATRWVLLGNCVVGQTLQDWMDNTEAGTNGIDIRVNQTGALPASAVYFTGGSTWTNATTLSQTFNPGLGVRVLVRAPFLTTNQQGNGMGVLSNVGALAIGNGVNGNPEFNFSFGGLITSGLRWNLRANPYPAVLNFDTTGWVKTHMENTLWTWSYDRYQTYNATTQTSINGGSPYIAKGQGFFVRTTGGGFPVLQVNESAKTIATKSILRSAAPASTSRLKMEMRNAAMTQADETAILLFDGATMGLDESLDAAKMTGQTHNISTLTNTGESLCINSIASQSSLAANTIVPVKVTANELGTYTISFTEFLNLDNVQMYLVDKYVGTITSILPGTVYSFDITSNPLSQGDGRLEINFSPASITNVALNPAKPQLSIYPNPAQQVVTLQTDQIILNASLYTLTGQLVPTTLRGNNINLRQVPAGMYIVQVQTTEGLSQHRLVVE